MTEARLKRTGSPTGWNRLLFRAPIGLYRVGLGFVMGHRFTMLEHTGRKSGETRRAVLDVVVDDPDAIYVVAAWGSKAQWLQNIEANPRVEFHVGSQKYRAAASLVSRTRGHEIMDDYAERHPVALDKLAKFMLEDPGSTPGEQAARIADSIPMVRLPKNAS